MAKLTTLGHAVPKAHLQMMVASLRRESDLVEEKVTEAGSSGHVMKFTFRGRVVFWAMTHSSKKVYLVRALPGMIELREVSTYREEMKVKYPNRPYATNAKWELLNIRKALNIHSFLNTPEEVQRLIDVTAELKARRKEGR